MTEPEKKQTKVDTNFFQRKVAGLPMWVIIAAVGLLVLGLVYYFRKSSSAASTADTSNTDESATVPPFINQVYTGSLPPSSPTMPKKKPPTDNEKSVLYKLKAGGRTFDTLAKHLGMSAEEFAKLNPELAKKYQGTGKKIPRGTEVHMFPKHTTRKDKK